MLLLGGLLFRLYTSADPSLHPWDEKYHAVVAKHMISEPMRPTLYQDPVLPYQIKNWWGNHIWVHKQPLPLWCMALSMKLFGVRLWALRLPSILLSTIGIWITFLLGRRLYNDEVGFIAAFLFSIHGLIIEVTSGRVATDHIDLFFLVLIEIAVYMALKFAQSNKWYYNILTGLFIGLAILSKWLPALIVLPIWLLLMFSRSGQSKTFLFIQFLFLLVITALVALPWQIYILKAFPEEARTMYLHNALHITEVLDGREGGWFFHLDNMRILFGELIYVALLWFIYRTIRGNRDLKNWVLILWVMIPYLFFSVVATKMQGYVLFTAPALFLVTAKFWVYLKNRRNDLRPRWLVVLTLVLLLALPVRYSLERIKPFSNSLKVPGWVTEVQNLKITDTKTVIFNSPFPIETMFYHECSAYGHLPDQRMIDSLRDAGYDVVILHDND